LEENIEKKKINNADIHLPDDPDNNNWTRRRLHRTGNPNPGTFDSDADSIGTIFFRTFSSSTDTNSDSGSDPGTGSNQDNSPYHHPAGSGSRSNAG